MSKWLAKIEKYLFVETVPVPRAVYWWMNIFFAAYVISVILGDI